MTFEKCFETGEIKFDHTHEGRGAAIATGLCGWATCMAGNKPPENFGHVMVKIGNFLGCSASPDSLSKASDDWMVMQNKK